MKVWVVEKGINHEGGSVSAVYDSREAAARKASEIVAELMKDAQERHDVCEPGTVAGIKEQHDEDGDYFLVDSYEWVCVMGWDVLR